MGFLVTLSKAVFLLFATMVGSLIAITAPFWTGYGTYYGAIWLWGNSPLNLVLGIGVGVLTFAIVQHQWKKSLEQSAVVFPIQP